VLNIAQFLLPADVVTLRTTCIFVLATALAITIQGHQLGAMPLQVDKVKAVVVDLQLHKVVREVMLQQVDRVQALVQEARQCKEVLAALTGATVHCIQTSLVVVALAPHKGLVQALDQALQQHKEVMVEMLQQLALDRVQVLALQQCRAVEALVLHTVIMSLHMLVKDIMQAVVSTLHG